MAWVWEVVFVSLFYKYLLCIISKDWNRRIREIFFEKLSYNLMLEWKSFETGSKSYWKEISAIFINFNVGSTFDFSSSCGQFHQHFKSIFFGQKIFCNFYLLTVWLCNFLVQKLIVKCWWNCQLVLTIHSLERASFYDVST